MWTVCASKVRRGLVGTVFKTIEEEKFRHFIFMQKQSIPSGEEVL